MMSTATQLNLCLLLGAVFFGLGVYGVLTSKNAVSILMSIEIMHNAACLNFIAFSRFTKTSLVGQVFVLFVIALMVAETVIGLSIILALYKVKETIDVDKINIMRW